MKCVNEHDGETTTNVLAQPPSEGSTSNGTLCKAKSTILVREAKEAYTISDDRSNRSVMVGESFRGL